jgi:Sulfotransferase domain
MSLTTQRKPDFFIVGQPKAGTSALYSMLRQHPGIFMPNVKEPMYMATDLRPRDRGRGHVFGSLEEYLALFGDAKPGQLAGEASTLYLLSKTAASSIAQLNRDARVVAIFREPASFLHSWFLQLRSTHGENARSLRKALGREPERAVGRKIPSRASMPAVLQYSEHLRYTDQLRRYHDELSRSQVLTLIYDDYKANNRDTIERILEFLGVEGEAPISPLVANTSVWMRAQPLDAFFHWLAVGRDPRARPFKLATKAMLPRASRRRLLSVLSSRILRGAPPEPDPELAAEIRSRFKPEVERFGDYIGRDLVSLWGYDRVA